MQERDKFGKFLKGKVVKKKKKARKIFVQKKKKGLFKSPKLSDLDLFDLQDIIQAEVIFQLGNNWK